MSATSSPTTPGWTFDASRFGTLLADRREQAGLSTRDVARRAGVSQSYVVALEGARHRGSGPTPTLDVVARLADALNMPPTELFGAGLRRRSTHVLLVTAHTNDRSLPLVRRTAPVGADQWVVASSSAPARLREHHINLRRSPATTYQPARIERALHQELAHLEHQLNGVDVGFVFEETSSVMRTLDHPEEVLDFESQWANVVTDAATAIGAHAAWNVCVYRLDHLRELPDPVDATLQLMRSHDTTWFARRQGVATGIDAALHIVQHMKPLHTPVDEWDATAAELVADIDFAA